MPAFFAGSGGPNSIQKKTGGVVEAYYDAFNREDYDALLSLFPGDLYEKVSREQMRGIFASYRQKLGILKSRKLHFARENHGGGESRYMLQFSAQYENSDSHDTFNIVRKKGEEQARLAKVEYDSPALRR